MERNGRMAGISRWEVRQIECPEGDRVSRLLLEWGESRTGVLLQGVQCDCARLKDLDNWQCAGLCWEQIAATGERQLIVSSHVMD